MLGRSTESANRIGRVLKPVQGGDEEDRLESWAPRETQCDYGAYRRTRCAFSRIRRTIIGKVQQSGRRNRRHRENHNSPRTTGASSHTSGVPESTLFFLAEAHFSLDNRNDKRQHPLRLR